MNERTDKLSSGILLPHTLFPMPTHDPEGTEVRKKKIGVRTCHNHGCGENLVVPDPDWAGEHIRGRRGEDHCGLSPQFQPSCDGRGGDAGSDGGRGTDRLLFLRIPEELRSRDTHRGHRFQEGCAGRRVEDPLRRDAHLCGGGRGFRAPRCVPRCRDRLLREPRSDHNPLPQGGPHVGRHRFVQRRDRAEEDAPVP